MPKPKKQVSIPKDEVKDTEANKQSDLETKDGVKDIKTDQPSDLDPVAKDETKGNEADQPSDSNPETKDEVKDTEANKPSDLDLIAKDETKGNETDQPSDSDLDPATNIVYVAKRRFLRGGKTYVEGEDATGLFDDEEAKHLEKIGVIEKA